MIFVRRIAMTLSLCALGACGSDPGECLPHGGTASVLDVLLIAASITCLAVTAATSDSEEDTAKTAIAAADPAPPPSPAVPPTEEDPTDPGDQYVLALQTPEPEISGYWLCRSASQEHRLQNGALYLLGDLHQRRYADPVASYMWYRLAEQHGNAIAPRRLEELRHVMTAEQVRAGESMAVSWKPGDCGTLTPVAAGNP